MFNDRRQMRKVNTQARWALAEVLKEHGHTRTIKGRHTTKPFIDHHTKRILIGSSTGFTLNLFGGHVNGCADLTWAGEGIESGLHYRNTKVTEDHLMLGVE